MGQVFPGGLGDALAAFRAETEYTLQQRMRQVGVIMAHSLRIILALRVRRRAHRDKIIFAQPGDAAQLGRGLVNRLQDQL